MVGMNRHHRCIWTNRIDAPLWEIEVHALNRWGTGTPETMQNMGFRSPIRSGRVFAPPTIALGAAIAVIA